MCLSSSLLTFLASVDNRASNDLQHDTIKIKLCLCIPTNEVVNVMINRNFTFGTKEISVSDSTSTPKENPPVTLVVTSIVYSLLGSTSTHSAYLPVVLVRFSTIVRYIF